MGGEVGSLGILPSRVVVTNNDDVLLFAYP